MKVIAAVGDYYHDQKLFKEALLSVTKGILNLEIEFVAREQLAAHLKEVPGIVILGSENRLNPEEENVEFWLTKSEEAEITEYVKKGGSWLAWHSGMASYEDNASFIDMLGGYFMHHPDDHVNVRYEYAEDHGLSKAKDSFEITDEHYFINNDKDVSVFLTSTSEHGDSVAAWTKSYGDGKVCCYVPAHNEEGLMHASVQSDLKHILKWLS